MGGRAFVAAAAFVATLAATAVTFVVTERFDGMTAFADPPKPWRSVWQFELESSTHTVAGVVTDSDSIAIYTLITDELRSSMDGKGAVVYSTTHGEIGTELYTRGAPEAWNAVIQDFNLANRTAWSIWPLPPFVGTWQVVSRPLARIGFDQPDQPARLEVSAVGFDRSRTRALLWMSFSCSSGGEWCASGRFMAFQKIDGPWREVSPPGMDLTGWVLTSSR